MKLAHQRPAKLTIFAALARFLAGQDAAKQQAVNEALPDARPLFEKNTSHGGRMAFNFDRRRAHLRRMKARRSHA